MHDINLFSNEELLKLAVHQCLIDDYRTEGGRLMLYLKGKKVSMNPSQARGFLAGLLWKTRNIETTCPATPHAKSASISC